MSLEHSNFDRTIDSNRWRCDAIYRELKRN
jgi:hypothetical protein